MLYCRHNKIKTLPIFERVEDIVCINNKIRRIKNMPKLMKLFCSRNRIKSIKPINGCFVSHDGNKIKDNSYLHYYGENKYLNFIFDPDF